MKNKILVTVLLVMALSAILAACSTQPAAPADSGTTSSSNIDAAALVDNNCAKCHSLDKLSEEKRSADGWVKIVDQMDKKGNLGFTTDEKSAIADYLTEKYQ